MKSRLRRYTQFIPLLFLLEACGYSTQGFVNIEHNSIYVKPVVNKIVFTGETQESSSYRSFPPLIENDFTRKIIDRFNIDGRLKPATQEDSELVVETQIKDFVRDAIGYTDNDQVREYRLKLYFTYSLYDKEGKLLRKKDLVADVEYPLEGVAAKTESQALNELLEDAARRLVESIIEVW